MIDLHSHILPGLDDGASDLAVSLEMARMQVAQGVTVMACTPHILPGVYHNHGNDIRQAVTVLQQALDDAGIELSLVSGADNHIVPDFVDGLREGRLLSLADTRYVLVEPPHNVAPARLDEFVFGILLAGYVPVITHPERLRWIEERYDLVQRLAEAGVWMQVTSGSLGGRFGRRAKYWAERMTCEGRVQILASDAHDTTSRPPDLASGWRAVERLVGGAEAVRMVRERPRDMMCDRPAAECAPVVVDRGEGERGHEGDGSRAVHRRDGAVPGWLRRFFRQDAGASGGGERSRSGRGDE
ncbi:hypothetical protein GCM10019059_45000 [Camelimonas fluminis]|uniref:protein-tyrosine-phosphatase n=1 Tax=Camelimonas fluminis TaxID=1576911 RepID=A0ABV7UN89_9HYPH|nr:CpsB/CapC family capsule biosynthesis tyrosine phosphatase [Camelimonas fluminis]GHE82717.1 hypothetical protein GCM10019059_45000 [Camelimonas fluminis]